MDKYEREREGGEDGVSVLLFFLTGKTKAARVRYHLGRAAFVSLFDGFSFTLKKRVSIRHDSESARSLSSACWWRGSVDNGRKGRKDGRKDVLMLEGGGERERKGEQREKERTR